MHEEWKDLAAHMNIASALLIFSISRALRTLRIIHRFYKVRPESVIKVNISLLQICGNLYCLYIVILTAV